ATSADRMNPCDPVTATRIIGTLGASDKNLRMRFVDVGGEHLSAIGVGTWQFGSREWAYGKDYADTTAVDIVHRALDLGVNVIDTAEVYGFGKSERIVGRAIAGRRDKAFVASKLLPVVPPVGGGYIAG